MTVYESDGSIVESIKEDLSLSLSPSLSLSLKIHSKYRKLIVDVQIIYEN